MTAYPFTRVSKSEFVTLKARAVARKARRAEKRIELAQSAIPPHASAASQDAPGGVGSPQIKSRTASTSKRGKGAKSKKPKSSRKMAFNRLKDLCRQFVMLRGKYRSKGMCEIAMSCRGEMTANTWYHAWPQKGGNGLKYDTRSHFASCGPCNMGEYGARMAGSDLYKRRHRELIDEIYGPGAYDGLDALHGRKQISTREAVEMGNKYKALIESKNLS